MPSEYKLSTLFPGYDFIKFDLNFRLIFFCMLLYTILYQGEKVFHIFEWSPRHISSCGLWLPRYSLVKIVWVDNMSTHRLFWWWLMMKRVTRNEDDATNHKSVFHAYETCSSFRRDMCMKWFTCHWNAVEISRRQTLTIVFLDNFSEGPLHVY